MDTFNVGDKFVDNRDGSIGEVTASKCPIWGDTYFMANTYNNSTTPWETTMIKQSSGNDSMVNITDEEFHKRMTAFKINAL